MKIIFKIVILSPMCLIRLRVCFSDLSFTTFLIKYFVIFVKSILPSSSNLLARNNFKHQNFRTYIMTLFIYLFISK